MQIHFESNWSLFCFFLATFNTSLSVLCLVPVPKKMNKKRKLTDGSRKLVQPIPLDSSGRPVFPIVLGGLTVYSLGEVSSVMLLLSLPRSLSHESVLKCSVLSVQIITDRMLFHDECAIYPVGFCSTRVFASMKNPDQQCLYTCQIKDGGAGPQVRALVQTHKHTRYATYYRYK